MAIFIVI